MEVGAKLIDWKAKWHPHGKGPSRGSIVDGLGMALHTWGGTANTSSCLLKVYPDGGVESFCGTQDLGTGNSHRLCPGTGRDVRTWCWWTMFVSTSVVPSIPTVARLVVARRSGRCANRTVARVRTPWKRSSRWLPRKLDVDASVLEAVGGRIRDSANRNKSIAWRKACSLIGLKPLEVTSNYQARQRTARLVRCPVAAWVASKWRTSKSIKKPA